MAITIAQMCDAVNATLGTAASLSRSQSYDELTGGMNDTPTLQVYWESTVCDVGGNNDRTSFRGGVRQKEYTLHADIYANQLKNVGPDNELVVNLADEIEDILEAQDTKPYFGLAGIQAFRWEATRVIFSYDGVSFPGARYIITLRVF